MKRNNSLKNFVSKLLILITIAVKFDTCVCQDEANATVETITGAPTTTNATEAPKIPFFVDDAMDPATMKHIQCTKRQPQSHHYNRLLPPSVTKTNGSKVDCANFTDEIQLEECSVTVINKLDLLQIKKIDEEVGSIRMLMIVRQYWTDKRLSLPPEFDDGCPNVTIINNQTAKYDPDEMVHQVWLPDTFIHGIQEIYKPEILMKPQTFGMNDKGRIKFTMFGVFTLSCSMTFHNFPMDIQYCPVYLESWRLTEDSQTLVWARKRPIGVQKAYSLDQFTFSVRVLDIHHVEYSTGNFSQLGVVLIFSRKLPFYLLQIYFPTVLFVIISWLTFIIPPSYAQGRIILTITTMLTLAALFSLVGVHSPSTSYLKAVDVWMFVCLAFVFAAVVDCLVDIRLLFVVSQSYKRQKLGFLTPVSVALVENRRVFADFFGGGDEDEQVGASTAPSEFFDVASRPDITATGSRVRSILRSRSSEQRSTAGLGVNFAAEPAADVAPAPSEPQSPESQEERWHHRADVFESMSIVLYPAAFLLFNVCYWAYYLTAARPPEELAELMRRGFTPKPIVQSYLHDGSLEA
ncbi:glycine receptor subunit alpha-2-like [Amphibalanus amphitrite]|uniref:glycine receptor subunit alpha-2-like n=1 Tax=Amphibalanus amphitrite TaxID=1232801 RepID=UPI001C924FC7|nr:glycine receptor subunit alpha-2-like [Amphibalanus amphitrite]